MIQEYFQARSLKTGISQYSQVLAGKFRITGFYFEIENNVTNLVPPYKEGENTHHSTSAVLVFAIGHLKVGYIIIMGHSGCGGVEALMDGIGKRDDNSYSFIEPWVVISKRAKQSVLEKYPTCSHDEQLHHYEDEGVLVSLENLHNFP